MTADPSSSRRFAIAFSFPGEHWDYVEQVARALLPALGGEQGKARVFYDDWHENRVIGYGSNEALLFAEEYERVLPFRFDMVDIPGSFKTDVFPVVTERSPEDIARLIVERYNEIQQDIAEAKRKLQELQAEVTNYRQR